jgi:hypothetical protein
MMQPLPSNSITFSGTANDTTTTTVNGVLTINGIQHYFVGCEADNILNGVFNCDGNQVTFHATGVAASENIEIPTLNISMTLELIC